jgi:Asp/Glu/Hydantoin racemase
MRIGCLHTADSNIAVFDTARHETARQSGPLDQATLHHTVRADLLAAAEKAGGLTPEIAEETIMALRSLCEAGADVVVLTCSTLGPVVLKEMQSGIPGVTKIPVLRVDRALAEASVENGGRVVALCAVETTLRPTGDLFELTARATGAQVDIRLVPGAWTLFKAGQREGYLDAIAAAADSAFREGATVVALAQASMAGAVQRCKNGVPLNSPAAGLKAASMLGPQ